MVARSSIRFFSTKAFDKKWRKRVGDDELPALQQWLMENPRAGDVIARTGGARKLRWARPGSGKRGGVRVIYYYLDAKGAIWLLGVYAKNERDDLSDRDMKALATMISELKE